MIESKKTPTLGRLVSLKPAGSGGTPSAAPAGLPLPPRRAERQIRPPSIARFPGLLYPQSDLSTGGTAL